MLLGVQVISSIFLVWSDISGCIQSSHLLYLYFPCTNSRFSSGSKVFSRGTPAGLPKTS